MFHSTGSYPNPPPGRQREIRFMPIQMPRAAPYFSIAWRVYSLHVGQKRQTLRPPVIGDIAIWYTLIKNRDSCFILITGE